MSNGFLMLIRSADTMELIRHPNEFTLLTLIAYRARRNGSFSTLGLEPGEALIGDHRSIGLSRQQYRTALKNLKNWEFLTTRATNKGTVAKIIKSTVYDINADDCNQPLNQSLTTSQPPANHQPTTNNKDKKEKKGKKEKIFMSDSDEIRLSAHLLDAILSWKPDLKKPDIQKWATHIGYMIRLDGRSPARIREVIDWCQAEGNFWRPNVLSTEKLRKQFDRLDAGMRETENGKRLSRNTNGQAAGRGGAARAAAGKYDSIPYISSDAE
ncbi:MAG: hypothetical protein ACOWWM_01145 [Desulfobacterales bacterium]